MNLKTSDEHTAQLESGDKRNDQISGPQIFIEHFLQAMTGRVVQRSARDCSDAQVLTQKCREKRDKCRNNSNTN